MQKKALIPDLESIQMPLGKVIILHLLPGAILTLLFVVIAPILHNKGIPSAFTFMILTIFVLIPIELGVLFYQGKKQNHKLSLRNIVLYNEPMPVWQMLIIIVVLLAYSILINNIIYAPIGTAIKNSLFGWLPEWFFIEDSLVENLDAISNSFLLLIAILNIIVAVGGPIVEELYFRGYLLPRMSRFGIWSAILSLVLHSIYHFWMPWQILGFVIGLLPAILIIWKKKNIKIGIFIHVLANGIGAFSFLITVLT